MTFAGTFADPAARLAFHLLDFAVGRLARGLEHRLAGLHHLRQAANER